VPGVEDKKLHLGIIVNEDTPVLNEMGKKVFRPDTTVQEIVQFIDDNV